MYICKEIFSKYTCLSYFLQSAAPAARRVWEGPRSQQSQGRLRLLGWPRPLQAMQENLPAPALGRQHTPTPQGSRLVSILGTLGLRTGLCASLPSQPFPKCFGVWRSHSPEPGETGGHQALPGGQGSRHAAPQQCLASGPQLLRRGRTRRQEPRDLVKQLWVLGWAQGTHDPHTAEP